MKLSDLEVYDQITIQCHDNPDADALASGYGLYCYFSSKGKSVQLIYSGRAPIQKANLTLMIDRLHLPITYLAPFPGQPLQVLGLLITVDCQYGEGNVTPIEAEDVAIIDHHQDVSMDFEKKVIVSSLGSCATLVWKLLSNEGFCLVDYPYLETALYYGLYTDTGQFAELYNPLDMDMRESLHFDKNLITLFRNSNLSLRELEIAGVAMIRYSYNDDYHFAVIQAQPCDPNILGLISDFLLQVAEVTSCLVYNKIEGSGDYKLSVRSCIKEVNASELAAFLTEGIGNGGGHLEKAGGYVNHKLYAEKHPSTHSEAFFNNRMIEYFNTYDILYAQDYEADLSTMPTCRKKKIPYGYVKATDCLPLSTPIALYTGEGEIEQTVTADLIFVISPNATMHPTTLRHLRDSYDCLNESFVLPDESSLPIIKNKLTGDTVPLLAHARTCIPAAEALVHARKLEKGVKVFSMWDNSRYITGNPGDYLVVLDSNVHDLFVVKKETFEDAYEKV